MCFSAESAFLPAPEFWNKSYPNVKLFAVNMVEAATPQRDFPPLQASAQCSWNHDKAPSQAVFPCNQWMDSTPQHNAYFSAVCLFTAIEIMMSHTGPRNIGLIYSAYGGTSITQWSPPQVYAGCPGASAPHEASSTEPGASVYHEDSSTELLSNPTLPASSAHLSSPIPGGLFNAMISPLVRYALRSFLWFQGEADAGSEAARPGFYACRFARLIAHWRRVWGMGDVAFCFVQLGPVTEAGTSFGLVRVAQTLVLPHPNGSTDLTGMAVAYDLGDAASPFDSVHFRNKVVVARRLAAAVLHTQFALQNASLLGPVVTGVSRVAVPGRAAVQIDMLVADGSGVKLINASQCAPDCCQAGTAVQLSVSGEAGPWLNTSIAIKAGSASVVATSLAASTDTVTHVRAGFGDYPTCAIVGQGNGFPVPTFLLPVPGPLALEHALEQQGSFGPNQVELESETLSNTNGGSLVWRGRTYHWLAGSPPPPLGLNTWNAFHANVDESLVLAVADAFVSLGLKQLGYQYVNIDDGWQVARMANGTIIEDPVRFPSGMRALADAVHQRGLLLGLYTSQTALTCQRRPGSYAFESIDVARYCEYGIDYIKVPTRIFLTYHTPRATITLPITLLDLY